MLSLFIVLDVRTAPVAIKPWNLNFVEGPSHRLSSQSDVEVTRKTFNDMAHALPTSGTGSRFWLVSVSLISPTDIFEVTEYFWASLIAAGGTELGQTASVAGVLVQVITQGP
jgi:hypothetical protein